MAIQNFWAYAAEHPDHIAVIDADESQTTHGEMLAHVNQLVHGLRALGLGDGSTVAAMLPNSREAYEALLATSQAGMYLTPINYHLVGPEVAYIVNDSEADVFIVHARYADVARAAMAELSLPKERLFSVGGQIEGFTPYEQLKTGQPKTQPEHRLAGRTMGYTSGTTGRPKGVRRALSGTPTDEFVWIGALGQYGIQPGEPGVHLLCCPWYHTAPLVMSGPSVHLGHTLLIMDRFDPERFLQLTEKYGATVTHAVPTQFVRFLNLPEEAKHKYDLSTLKVVIHGAAPCPPEVKRRMIEWWGNVIFEYYASTEAGGTMIKSDEWLNKPGSVGRPTAASIIKIYDDDGNELPPGQVGTIYMLPTQGPFKYFKDDEKTDKARRGDLVTVGDAGYFDEDGYLYLSDRKIDMIVSGGVNIYPAEIENVLITHPKVQDIAVFGIPNAEWGEEIKAVAELRPGHEGSDAVAQEILEFLNGKIARYKIPKTLDFTDAMPRDPSGKLYKRKLRDPYWAGHTRAI
jgi:long-chain acyl-CoA synthetase